MSKIDDLLRELGRYFLSDGDREAECVRHTEEFKALQAEIATMQKDAAHWNRLLKSNDHPDDLLRLANNAIHLAGTTGMVVRIETRPLHPLAMGHYEMVATVQERRTPGVPYADLKGGAT